MVTLINVLVKRIPVVVMLIGVMLLNACKDSDKNSSLIFEELNESLERSNANVHYSSIAYLKALDSYRTKPETSDKAEVWGSFADSIHLKTNAINDFIDSLVKKIKRDQGIDKKDAEILYEKIIQHRKDILNVNEEIRKTFDTVVMTANAHFGERFKTKDEFCKQNFGSQLSLISLVVLSKFRNDILTTENQTLAFCVHKVPNYFDGYHEFLPIAFQNSKRFSPGEELEISLGMGSFSLSYKPTFIINEAKVNPDERGAAIFKMKVENKAGKYKVPIVVEYTMPDGTKSRLQKFIEYTVVE